MSWTFSRIAETWSDALGKTHARVILRESTQGEHEAILNLAANASAEAIQSAIDRLVYPPNSGVLPGWDTGNP